MSAQKTLQGSKSRTKELLGGTTITNPQRGVIESGKNGILARLDMHVNTINTLGWLATMCVCVLFTKAQLIN